VTWINTFVLLGSCVPLWLAGRAFLRADRKGLLRGLVAATVMGAAFLAIQGMEWTRLVTHGLTVAHGVYGGLFVILIGTHALHVLGAVVWLAIVTGFALAGRLRGPVSESFDMVRMYWVFVAAVWIALFAMVYLA